MSERKTTEIKFRTSPTWKARVQSAAAEADESLSEFIEKAVDDRMRAEQFVETNVPLATGYWEPLPRASDAEGVTTLDPDASQFETLLQHPIVGSSVLGSFWVEGNVPISAPGSENPSIAPTGAVSTSGDESRVERPDEIILIRTTGTDPKPWMFEARNGE